MRESNCVQLRSARERQILSSSLPFPPSLPYRFLILNGLTYHGDPLAWDKLRSSHAIEV